MTPTKITIALLSFAACVSCASYETKINSDIPQTAPADSQKILSIYLMGDAGLANDEEAEYTLNAFADHLKENGNETDAVIYLGDNIYPSGLPSKDSKNRKTAELYLDTQVAAVKDFKGITYFIPGNHDWYSKGPKGLKRQEEYIEKALNDKNAFQPEKGCPIKKIELDDNIELIILDTQWYLADWDRYPTINDECDIKTRKDFFIEFEGELKKNNEKTVIVAMHHPAMTYGPHGGNFGAKHHLFPTSSNIPLPILGTLVTQIRSQGGVSIQDRYNQRYNDLMNRITTLVTASDRAVLVSGHEHTLQYIDLDNVKQIVSGSGSKKNPVALGLGAQYVSGNRGFAVLDIYEDRSSQVRFYEMNNGKANLSFTGQVHEKEKPYDVSNLASNFDSTTKAKVYSENTDKSRGYRKFWGDHYRYVYGTEIEVPVITLDSYRGGFDIERKGGGHQTRSLRLNGKTKGRNFALRAVKKSAVQFLQTVAFKEKLYRRRI